MGIYRDEHDAMRAAVRGLLERAADSAAVRRTIESGGYDGPLWKRMSDELGLPGLAVPEELGGSGFGIVETAVALEEVGRAILPSPLWATTVAALALVDAGGPRDLVEPLASGQRTAAVHLGDGWTAEGDRVTGRIGHVADGVDADQLVLVGDHHGAVVDLHGPGVRRTALETMDLTRPQARIELDDAPTRVFDTPTGWATRTTALAAALLAAEQVGGADRVLELSTTYASERVQFGRPVGSFQTVKHQLADMLVDLELARATEQYAVELAAAPSTDLDTLDVAARTAHRSCSGAFRAISAEAIRVHGGIGFTWEHDAHLYFRRARASAVLLDRAGDDRRLAAAAGLTTEETP